MILRKHHPLPSKATQSHPIRYKSLSTFNFINFSSLVLIYFMTFVPCSGAHGPHSQYRTYRPNSPPFWMMHNQTLNASVINNTSTTPLAETTTEASFTPVPTPVEDYFVKEEDVPYNEDIGEDETETNVDEEYEDDHKWSVAELHPEGSWTDVVTLAPNATVTDGAEYEATEVLELSEAPRTPEEELDQMLEGLENLLSNESAVVSVANVTDTFDQLDVLLEADLEFPCSMLHALDALGSRAYLNGSRAVYAARRHVAVVMADSAPAHPVRGLRIATTEYGFTDDAFEIIEDSMDPTSLASDKTDAVVYLPASLSESYRRISFVVFRSDRAFVRHDGDEQYVVNSKVISVNVENFTQMSDGEVIDIHFKPSIYKPARNQSRACAYWHFADNENGYWSQEGCTLIHSPTGLLDTCRCTHLTHFAEVLVPKSVFSEANELALEIISLIGCFLSLFGLFVIGVTAVLFRSWRNDFNNKIWIQLTLALLINVICFLIIVFSKFEDYSMFCFITGVLLHYSVLASFCWMLVAAIISYRKLVLIFARDPSRKLLKASAFCWFFPLAVVTILVAIAPESYARRFERKMPNGAFCYPSGLGLWLSVYTPIAIIVATNWILFVLIIKSVFATRKIQKHGDSSEVLRRASVSCLLVFLFGLPWVFGLVAYNIVAAYLFTLTTSYQGFVLFVFFVIINTKTRGMWLTKLRLKKTKAPVSSSLVTNKSEPARDESEQAFIEPHTTVRTNVTSLMSNLSDEKVIAYNVSQGSAFIEDCHSNYRDDSEGSFKTAKSFDNIYENEADEERSKRNFKQDLPRIVAVIEKTQSVVNANDSSSTSEKLCTDKTISSLDNNGNHSLEATFESNNEISFDNSTVNNGNKSVDDSIDTSLPTNLTGDPISKRLGNDKTNNIQNEKNISSQNEGNDDDSMPQITIYNVPTQSASLIS